MNWQKLATIGLGVAVVIASVYIPQVTEILKMTGTFLIGLGTTHPIDLGKAKSDEAQ